MSWIIIDPDNRCPMVISLFFTPSYCPLPSLDSCSVALALGEKGRVDRTFSSNVCEDVFFETQCHISHLRCLSSPQYGVMILIQTKFISFTLFSSCTFPYFLLLLKKILTAKLPFCPYYFFFWKIAFKNVFNVLKLKKVHPLHPPLTPHLL